MCRRARNPFDAGVVPAPLRATSVASHGFRPVQLHAQARVLRGKTNAYDRLPVALRPPEGDGPAAGHS